VLESDHTQTKGNLSRLCHQAVTGLGLAVLTAQGALRRGEGARCRKRPPQHPPRLVDLALDGLTLLVTDGPAAVPVLRQAASAFADAEIP
jgi:hypothetical protein